ncbi:hypothetical protein HDU93_002960, partial [Gonapodya sp. JEL0774]
GIFSLIAGRAGYPSLAFDLQRRCARLFRCAATWNGYKRHEIRLKYVTDAETTASGKLIEADAGSCVGGRAPRPFPKFEGEKIMISPVYLTDFLEKRDVKVALIKIDTEGYEPVILSSLEPLFQKRGISDILVELTPWTWHGLGNDVDETLNGTFKRMYEKYGMTAHLLHGVNDAEYPLDLKKHITPFRSFESFAQQVRDSSTAGWIDIWFSLDPKAILDSLNGGLSQSPLSPAGVILPTASPLVDRPAVGTEIVDLAEDSVQCDNDGSDAVILRHKWTGGEWIWPEGQESSSAVKEWFDVVEGAGTTLVDRILRHRKLNDTHHFIDVGSHQGIFSLLAGRAGYRSLAFDMQRRCACLFECAATWNGYKGHEIRLGYVTDGETAASGKKVEADAGSCVGGRAPRPFPEFVGEKIMVPPTSLTDFIAKRDIRVAMLKIDTEGYEPVILRSLESLLEKRAIPDILVELTPANWNLHGSTIEETLSDVFKSMYEQWGMTASLLQVVPAETKHPLDLESFVTPLLTFESFAEQVLATAQAGLWIDIWFSLDPSSVVEGLNFESPESIEEGDFSSEED